MFYSCELDKVTSRLMDRPALQYIYQDTDGKYIASDGLSYKGNPEKIEGKFIQC